MKRFFGTCLVALSMAGPAFTATVTNKDGVAAVLVVVEGENRAEVAVAPGATESLCPNGCFITTPSGDHLGLEGDETVEIVDGSAVIK